MHLPGNHRTINQITNREPTCKMKKYLYLLTVLSIVWYAPSCKKSNTTATTAVTDTCKGTIHVNYRGVDYNYTYSNHDSLKVAKIDQGNAYYNDTLRFSKRFLLTIPDKRATFTGYVIQIYANKLNETEDTGMYKMGGEGNCSYGNFYFWGYTSADTVNNIIDTSSSFAHITEFTRGVRNHMKGTFQLAVGLRDSYYNSHFIYDSVFYIKGDFDITK